MTGRWQLMTVHLPPRLRLAEHGSTGRHWRQGAFAREPVGLGVLRAPLTRYVGEWTEARR